MNDFVDTVGWDVAISVPLAITNSRLAAQRSRLIQSVSLTLTGALTYQITGEIAAWRVVEGQGAICYVDVIFGHCTLSVATPVRDAPANAVEGSNAEHDVSGVTLRLGFEWDLNASAGCGDADFGHDLIWRGDEAASGSGDAVKDRFSVAVLAPAGRGMLHEIRDLLKDVCSVGLPDCQSVIKASLARVLCANFSQGGEPVQIARAAWLITTGTDTGSLVMLFAFFRVADDSCAMSKSIAATLQPVIPAALPTDGRTPSVAISSRLLPSADPAQLTQQMLYAVQQPERAQPGPVEANDPAITPRLPSRDSFDVVTQVDAIGFDMSARGDVLLNMHKDNTVWHVSLSKFTSSMHGSELTLAYTCFPSIVQAPRRHVVQRFTLDVMRADESREPEIALRARLLSETLSTTGDGIFGALVSYCTPWLSVSERIKVGFDYLPIDLRLSLFGEWSLFPESGYMNGGVVFSTPDSDGLTLN